MDEEGPYFAATAVATDASAPCFDGNERFRVCPVWLSIAAPAQAAFRWRKHAERGTLATVIPLGEMSAWAMHALEEADRQVSLETSFTMTKDKK